MSLLANRRCAPEKIQKLKQRRHIIHHIFDSVTITLAFKVEGIS